MGFKLQTWAGTRKGGAAVGLTVSGLNHVVHRMDVKAKIDSQFDGTGMNPDDLVPNTRDELLTEAIRVKECLPELVRLDEQANFPGI